MFYIVGTPIGNLGDLSPRAREILARCDCILCEDTRHTGKLLAHFEIETRMMSYHRFNERERESQVMEWLAEGADIALVSDAGLPIVCDPGAELVRRLRAEGADIEVVPGPCAFAAAMAATGTEVPISFFGYPEKKTFVDLVRGCMGSAIFYVAPHDLRKVLGWCDREWQVSVARELTKKFEQVHTGTAGELLEEMVEPRGEMVMIVRGGQVQSQLKIDEATLVQRLEDLGVKPREAMRLVAELSGRSQKEIYALAKKG